MLYQLKILPYKRKFKHPLLTSHGIWELREGILLKLIDETGNFGVGEIAPISWFGSETIEEALEFCKAFSGKISQKDILTIPDSLPACQFGFESALPTAEKNLNKLVLNTSALLPSGISALSAWQSLWQQNYCTFKWKIGVAEIEEELKIFEQLIQNLPPTAKLRLDANSGLNWQTANQWLQVCDAWGKLEFLEQPLPVNQIEAMIKLSQQYSTPLALDESVANLGQMAACYQQGWRGIYVIKPGIAGSPSKLRKFCQTYQIDAVFSSVFETSIGRNAALNLASELSLQNRAVGFGVEHWFAESDENLISEL
ncbi:o-succinylbenzoate synthase [Ancylothrix sp. C2]|uniref:o-succinylbenzoate synthase n=1 Tax=Ancylothrix sp. D3o TaxID=2953691 RepID=UPI0021BA7BC1|nr:o-succinylbenzoate synthase [Ancylothrix sp. D3o]MCT7948775.1 o-succinylbenzoate synthase [Ancylothrix sp. D3o]